MPSGFYVPVGASSLPGAPIKLEGFDVPSPASSHPPVNGSATGYIDPAMLFSQYGSAQKVSSASPPYLSGSGGGAGFSDLDLDFDQTLASLSSFGHSPQQVIYSHSSGNGYGNSPHAEFSSFNYNPREGDGLALSSPDLGAGSHDVSSYTSFANPIPHFLSSKAASRPSPAISTLGSSPRDSRSPSSTVDMYGNPVSNNESPIDYGSYSSVGDSLLGNQQQSQTSTASTSASKQLRTSSVDRSRSNRIGKAPNSSIRSRSARRVSTSGAGSYQAPASSASSTSAVSAIIIPSSPAAPSVSHPLAMSMPTYPINIHGNSTNWFASAQALSLNHPAEGPTMDPSGWKPSRLQSGPGLMPSSAPALGGAKKGGSKGLDDVMEDPSQKQAALLTEKRRRRRESHNAVERRRRDNINDRIAELASLLPECLLDQVNNSNDEPPGSPGTPMMSMLSPNPGTVPLPAMGTSPVTSQNMSASNAANNAAAAAGKPNKGIILAKSVEYIRYLRQLVELHQNHSADLERIIVELRANHPGSANDAGSSGVSQSASPSDAQVQALVGSSFADPSFNEKFLNAAASGAFGLSGASWNSLKIPKEEPIDDVMDEL